MTLSNRLVALCIVAAPSLAMASPPAASLGTFHTTGGQTKLQMDVLSHDGKTMKVRLTDPTKIAFNNSRRSETLVLHRQPGGSVARGWTAYDTADVKGKDQASVTIEDAALAGKHGIVGMTINEWDRDIDGPKNYGVHFQLAGAMKK